ncbi:hypothetical protein [uncultured Allomuricauda sp.]|uniref:hypothetical protein n=1 Tax=Flagellimonas sp. W118 TaxID=3410791 RepID=UPI00260C8602|nr:hypothetical protein [uncultured Allomuricauda sp.]
MIKFKFFLAVIFVLVGFISSAQNKYERESRISKSEFPIRALETLTPYIEDAKKIKFYHEVDSVKQSFETKFKKGRLRYSVEFNTKGELEDVEFLIGENDIPNESWSKIEDYLNTNFQKVRVKKIQQQYPVGNSDYSVILKEAFQNLILDYINFELVFSAKNSKGFQTYEALFNSTGTLVKLRQSFSPKYDHLLY